MHNKIIDLISRRSLLKVSASTAVLASADNAFAAFVATLPRQLLPVGRDQPFDDSWMFKWGDGEMWSDARFDDRSWRSLDLPHDWSIDDLPRTDPSLNAEIREVDTAPLWQKVKTPPRLIGPFDAILNDNRVTARSASGAMTAFTVGGIGWYRKRFKLPPLDPGARVEIAFDGVYMNAEVWLNGARLGERPYGYSPFAFDLTPHLNLSGENVLAVRVANIGRNSRWYSGSGIFRHVRLDVIRAVHFERWGLTVTTPNVSAASATVSVAARIVGSSADTILTTRVVDANGRVAAEAHGTAANKVPTVLQLSRPRLWSPETPNLYRVECELHIAGQLVDTMTAPLGLRRGEIDPAHGLRINGKHYKLRGGCIHHDNGLLGAVAIGRAEVRKIELLKARGFNALRMSHNPPSSILLDACDRLGILVMDEAFDMWRVAKNSDDYALYFDEWWKEDLAAMVRRDGNHPSVILWSFGNEIPERGEPEGIATARMLADELRRLDPTRPITVAIPGTFGPDVKRADGTLDQAAAQFLDVAGYNYKLSSYDKDHARFPQRVMVGTESWPRDIDKVWRLTEQSSFLIGDFVWTAMDYLGEAAIGRTGLAGETFGPDEFPWFGASCGDIDLIGQQRPQSLARDVVWGLSPLEIAVQRPIPEGKRETPFLWGWKDLLQSWTWPGAESKPLSVEIYTIADRVKVELNDRLVEDRGLDPATNRITQIDIPYAPGRLVVTAYLAGKQIGRRLLETVGPPAALRLKVDRTKIRASRDDLAYATIEVVDAQGRLVPDAVHVLHTVLTGPTELAAFGNANPRGVASFRQPVAKSWHGQALAIVRPTGGVGVANIRVEAEGLRSAEAAIAIGRRS